MFSGARRLELRQNKNYGNDFVYQKYVKSIPILPNIAVKLPALAVELYGNFF